MANEKYIANFAQNVTHIDTETVAVTSPKGQFLARGVNIPAAVDIVIDVFKTPRTIENAIAELSKKFSNETLRGLKKHPVYGYRILQNSKLPQAVKVATLMHHEKFDGKGYPLGKGAEHIDKITSIVSICDIYEAMTADRVYRARESPFSVLEQFQKGRFGSLHGGYNMLFIEKIASSFIGNTVILSNGEQGHIIHLDRQNLSKPLIQCGNKFVDLATTENISIAMML